ncbi:M20 family metallopeptidase [Enteractinococcus fodinae]|uniref:Peptidase M20 domain-containing protein 2 n=1 Tax=Enteractinococcus fodinae TaxID=684663 RepID=A0ABU2B491_9MICC|nr:M20 family metallopeptidase [Enteractinococcus fodinae]MDR7348417.1 amidohydrolase [Enteractinococcus fodinae]
MTDTPIPAILDSLSGYVDGVLPELVDLAMNIHANPEIRFEEYHAAKVLTEALETDGFAVERGVGGLETAFVGRWSTSTATPESTTIAVFCEYDALEGIGHACGHNLIAACGLGAGQLVKQWLQENHDVPANLMVIGSPGEEGGAGKVPLIEANVLDGVDIAIMVHPSSYNAVVGASMARIALDIKFTGRASHAAGAPELGRNALDASVLALNAIGLLRQQTPDGVRIHGIVTDGGEAPNIIPEHTALRVFLRSGDQENLISDILPRVRACFEGAAIATGCEVEIQENTPRYESVMQNRVLAGLAQDAYEALGRDLVVPAGPRGSTDMGNVSQRVPAMHPMMRLADGSPHTREFADDAAGPAAEGLIRDGALMLAATAVAAFADRDIVERAHAAFEAGETAR